MNFFTAFKVNLALIGSVLLWSGSFPAIRLALQSYTPNTLAALRFVVASLCFLPFFWPIRRFSWLPLRKLLVFFFVGAVTIAGYALLLNHGEQHVSASLASFIISQTPVVTALLAMLLLRERPTKSTGLGIAISTAGLLIIVMGQEQTYHVNMSLILIMLATICGSVQSIIQKSLLTDMSPLKVAAFSIWCAAASMVIWLPETWQNFQSASLESTLAVFYLGALPSCLGSILWNYGLARTQVVNANAYVYGIPIFSTIIGWLLLGEIPTALQLIGGLIALLGAMLVKSKPAYQEETIVTQKAA